MQTSTTFDNTAEGWERSLYAFLAEKERRSGSRRTVVGYSRMLQHFFGSVGKPPDRVTSPEVFAWGYGVGLSGKQPSSVTIGARLACLSSFYRFLIRMDIISSNPCDALERPRVQVAPPRGLSELPQPAYVALTAALSAFGRDIATMPPDASLWPSSASDRGVTSGTFYLSLIHI